MKTYSLLLITLIALTSCKNKPIVKMDKKLTETEIIAKATKIHNKIITVDTHIDINVSNFTDSVNYIQELKNQVNLPKMNKGGLDVAWFIVYTGQDTLDEVGYNKAYKNALEKFAAIHKLIEKFAPNEIELALTSADAKRIHSLGKKVVMIGVENGYPIGTNIGIVKEFYDLGARYMSLAHNGHSQLSDSNTGESNGVWLHNGLSELGKQVILEMNKWGIMIDVSHPSKKAIQDMVELSKAPLIASHSSARALCNHSRNLDDEQLEWIKKSNGVVQAVAFSAYINTEKNNKFTEASKVILNKVAEENNFTILTRNEIKKMDGNAQEAYLTKYLEIKNLAETQLKEIYATTPPVNVADFVDHIDYLVKKIGIDHVGISSDFDGGGGIEGWNDASETLNVTIELVKRGYTEAEIEKLWGGNLFRVLDKVQKVALEIQGI